MSHELAIDDLGAILDRIEDIAEDLNDDQIEQLGDWLGKALSTVRREKDRRRNSQPKSL